MSLEKQLAQYIRDGDLKRYASARYPAIPDGEEIIFQDENFAGVDFSPFVLGFMTFKRCILDGTTMQGQPITIIDCSTKDINIMGKSAVIIAHSSDFRGMRYNSTSYLAKKENGDAGSSHFHNCRFDKATKRHFVRQGAVFM